MKPIAECDDCRLTVEWSVVSPGVYKCLNCHAQVTEKKLGKLRAAHQRREDAKAGAERLYQDEVEDAPPSKNR